MKKIISVILAAVLVFSFAGCSKKENNKSADNSALKIVCTIFPQYDFVRAITKGVSGIDLKMLLAPGNESHSYQASISDIATIKNADLFIYVGGETDKWVEDILKEVSGDSLKSIALTSLVKTLEESDEGILTPEEEEEEAEGKEADEHVWTSIKKSEAIINSLCDTLCSLDAKDSETFKANAKAYVSSLGELDSKFEDMVKTAKNKTIVIADRNPFRYFLEDYGIKAVAAFSGCTSNAEITLSTQNSLIKAVESNKLDTVFVIEFNTSPYADSICKQTGAKKAVLNSCHNVSAEDFKNGTTYLQLVESNFNTLEEAMK